MFLNSKIIYIKNRNRLCYYVGHYKLKPMDNDVLFKRKELIFELTSSIGSSTVTKKNDSAFTVTYTSVKDKYYEV